MGKKVKWSWTSALIGAASATAAYALVSAKPKGPAFNLVSIGLTNFNLNFPILDVELILTVHVTNPNIVPIRYDSTIMSICYDGSRLGSALVNSGSQPARSCRLLKLPARLDAIELAQHGKKFLADVKRREMELDATVDVAGEAKLWWFNHRFNLHVDSNIVVDPVLLDVVDQENKAQLQLLNA